MLSPILHITVAEQLASEALAATSETGAPFNTRAYALVQLATFHMGMADMLLSYHVPMDGLDDADDAVPDADDAVPDADDAVPDADDAVPDADGQSR